MWQPRLLPGRALRRQRRRRGAPGPVFNKSNGTASPGRSQVATGAGLSHLHTRRCSRRRRPERALSPLLSFRPWCLPRVVLSDPDPLQVCTALLVSPPSGTPSPSSRVESSATGLVASKLSRRDVGSSPLEARPGGAGPGSLLCSSGGLSRLTPSSPAAACSFVSLIISLPSLFTSPSAEGNWGNEG